MVQTAICIKCGDLSEINSFVCSFIKVSFTTLVSSATHYSFLFSIRQKNLEEKTEVKNLLESRNGS